MKANAPERIWIDLATDLPKLSGHIDKDGVEYTCTDAFMKKACDWLRNEIYTFDPRDTEKMIENFKKAMML